MQYIKIGTNMIKK